MKNSIVLFLFILIYSPVIAQEPESPVVTLKAGIGLSIVPSKHFSYPYITHTFYMPSLNVGILIKNWVYLGGFYTGKDKKTSPLKELKIGEVGVSVLKRFIVGLSIGKEYYTAPNDGWADVWMEDEIMAYGGFVDYQIIKYISVALRYNYVQDTPDSHGPSHYINIGVTGNLPIY